MEFQKDLSKKSATQRHPLRVMATSPGSCLAGNPPLPGGGMLVQLLRGCRQPEAISLGMQRSACPLGITQ